MRPVLAALVWSLSVGASSGSAAADVVGSGPGKTERGGILHGDAARGAQLYEVRCGGCHSIDSHRIGPLHRGVFGRRAGSAAGFEYSAALRSSALVWDEATLDRWLADPERTIPGQAMGYRVEQAQDRADLIAYLRRL